MGSKYLISIILGVLFVYFIHLGIFLILFSDPSFSTKVNEGFAKVQEATKIKFDEIKRAGKKEEIK